MLRGVQEADQDGVVEFTVCEEVYGGAEGYDESVTHLGELSLDTDLVFADGHSLQLAKATGSLDAGYTIALNVPV
jgi:hypothetical protein